jgi:hypothetical protein
VREVLHHMALALAVLSLSQAALRVAATIAPSGLERVIVALPIGVATVITETLALGLLGLGGSTVALVAAATATWAAALALLPSPVVAVLTELAAWWRRLHPLRGSPPRRSAAHRPPG